MKYLIGSRALSLYYPQKPKDWDILTSEPQKSTIVSGDRIEFLPLDSLLSKEICNEYADGRVSTPVGMATVVGPVGLMLIKRSHLHRPLKFQKHVRDYHLLKEKHGPETNEMYDLLLEERTKLTKEQFKDRTPKLNMSNEEFFDDYVEKFMDHDDIHRATCFYDAPIYERLKHDETKAYCAKDLWEQLSDEDKTKCVQEECRTISLERKLIPSWNKGETYPIRFAYAYAAERVCTTLCSGWFRDWAIEHWPDVMKDSLDYAERFKEQYEERTVGAIS